MYDLEEIRKQKKKYAIAIILSLILSAPFIIYYVKINICVADLTRKFCSIPPEPDRLAITGCKADPFLLNISAMITPSYLITLSFLLIKYYELLEKEENARIFEKYTEFYPNPS